MQDNNEIQTNLENLSEKRKFEEMEEANESSSPLNEEKEGEETQKVTEKETSPKKAKIESSNNSTPETNSEALGSNSGKEEIESINSSIPTPIFNTSNSNSNHWVGNPGLNSPSSSSTANGQDRVITAAEKTYLKEKGLADITHAPRRDFTLESTNTFFGNARAMRPLRARRQLFPEAMSNASNEIRQSAQDGAQNGNNPLFSSNNGGDFFNKISHLLQWDGASTINGLENSGSSTHSSFNSTSSSISETSEASGNSSFAEEETEELERIDNKSDQENGGDDSSAPSSPKPFVG